MNRRREWCVLTPNDGLGLGWGNVWCIATKNLWHQQGRSEQMRKRRLEWRGDITTVLRQKTKNAFVLVERIYSINTYLWISLSHEGMSEVSERSERCEWTNVASDRVACSKRVCLWLETPPLKAKANRATCSILTSNPRILVSLSEAYSIIDPWLKTKRNFHDVTFLVSNFKQRSSRPTMRPLWINVLT